MAAPNSLLNRTLNRLRQVWGDFNGNLKSPERRQLDPFVTDVDYQYLKQKIEDCLNAPGGDYAARAQAAHIGHAYLSLNPQGRERFWRLLAENFAANNDDIERAISKYQASRAQAGSDAELSRARSQLRQALMAPREKLLTLFNSLPEGVKFLVDMRGELLESPASKEPALQELERDLKNLLANWFDIGFLQLQQLTWHSPAALLEKLIEYEAVHEITSWVDLKNRLAQDRRLFAFFHPNMPDEPLIFVQVALCNGLAESVQALLDTNKRQYAVEQADTAIFYSISNAQQGLAGISFGNYLIKRVVGNLKRELPQLNQFATLSPIPGFNGWLKKQNNNDELLQPEERALLAQLIGQPTVAGLLQLLAQPHWHLDDMIAPILRPLLTRLAAVYLSSINPDKLRALDSVAHFHLSNGATLQQINWLADVSPKGMRQSHGLMVNYLYNLDTIDSNSEAYVQAGNVALSAELQQLLKPKEKPVKAKKLLPAS